MNGAMQSNGGKPIIENLGDENFKGMTKYQLKSTADSGVGANVHYVVDPKTKLKMDFKIKEEK